jgi:hypothetical protein
MRTRHPKVDISIATSSYRGVKARGFCVLALGASLTLSPVPVHGQTADTPPAPTSAGQTHVKLVMGGGATVKNNSEGTLSVVGSSLQFVTNKNTIEVEAASILDVSTDKDSRQDITGAAYLATEAIPYGGSRVLSLFSHKVDVLTVEFKDGNGAYHGAIFVLGQHQAAPIKKQLIAMGAKATTPLAEPAPVTK